MPRSATPAGRGTRHGCTATCRTSCPTLRADPSVGRTRSRPVDSGPMTTIDHAALLASARAILPDVIAVRRRLHRIPEIGNELPRTQALIADALRALGVEATLGSS